MYLKKYFSIEKLSKFQLELPPLGFWPLQTNHDEVYSHISPDSLCIFHAGSDIVSKMDTQILKMATMSPSVPEL